jgi:hypothetical protein
MISTRILLAALAVLAAHSTADAQDGVSTAGRLTTRAGTTAGASIRLDGQMREPVWQTIDSALFIVELNGEHDIGRMPEGNFTEDLLGTRLRVNVSPDQQFNS